MDIAAYYILALAGVLFYFTIRFLILLVPMWWQTSRNMLLRLQSRYHQARVQLKARAARQPKTLIWAGWFLILCAIPVLILLLPIIFIVCGIAGLFILYLGVSALISRELAR